MKRKIKDAIYEQFARTAKALSNPKRLEILDLLNQSEKTVEDLAQQAQLGIKNTSAQLKELKSAQLVDSRRNGKYIYYRLPNKSVSEFLLSLRIFNESQFAEIQKIASEAFAEVDALEPFNRKQLLAQAKKGEIVLIDVRPSAEYDEAHLPFAVSVPIASLQKELKNLPKNKKIVAYCRGPYCFFAKEAVELLKKRGFSAYRLKDGVQEWKSYGLPIESRQAV